MTPAAFDYVRAESLEHAIELKARLGDAARLLAGGQSLVPLLVMRLSQPEVVLDIGHLEGLSGLTTRTDGSILLGALTRHREVVREEAIGRAAPLLAEAARHVAHPGVRNLGTVGGAVALGDPAAEYPAVLSALGARIHLRSQTGPRTVEADAFFEGALETAAREDEIVTNVELMPVGAGDRFGFCEIAERKGDYALAGAAVALREATDGQPKVRVALFGVADRPLLVEEAGDVLASTAPSGWDGGPAQAAADAARRALERLEASPLTRHLAGVAVVRAAADLVSRARRT